MNHSTSKRTAKAATQVESTMLVEGITAKIVKCTARKSFQLGYTSVEAGETFFLVRSERREGRYYVVAFNTKRAQYQCSCGACTRSHEHLTAVKQYVVEKVVKVASPKVVETVAQDIVSEREYHKTKVISTAEAEKAIQEAEKRIEAGKDLSAKGSLNGAMPGWLAVLPSRSQKIA